MKIFVQDRVTYKAETARRFNDKGYLIVPGRAAKTGTQVYLRKELQLDGNPNDPVVVYRSPEEVFKPESLATYNNADVTFLHPTKMVDSESYSQISKGDVNGAGVPDGDYVLLPEIVVKDKATIDKVLAGTVELSAGYTAEYVPSKGVTSDGVAYEYEQRDIVINHVAFVPSARAGRNARIFDQQPQGNTMNKVTLDAGRTVEIQDEAVALLVTDAITRLQTALDAETKAKDEANAKADKAQAKADAMEEEAEKKKGETSDAVIAERLKQITEVTDKAKEIDAKYVADSIDPVVIMRGVLKATRDGVDWASKSDDYVKASFDIAHEHAKSGTSQNNAGQLRQIAQDGANGVTTQDAKTTTARDAYITRMTDKGEK